MKDKLALGKAASEGDLLAKEFRADIQALRALAISAVLMFHFWPNLMPAGFIGVDIFFVISGYFLIGSVLRQLDLGGFHLGKFWAKRIRRLLPASFTVIALAMVGITVLATDSQKSTMFWETLSASLYFENWTLAANSVDYSAANNATSPVQHFWALSVEEQFTLILPIALLLIAFLFARKQNKSKRKLLLALLSILFVVSFSYNIYLAELDPKVSYFSTWTRAWEFILGGLLVFLPKTEHWKNASRAMCIAIAFGLLLVANFVIGPESNYPGTLALLPVFATAILIWVGFNYKAISFRPIQHIGNISYSLFLWHWPLIILLSLYLGKDLNDFWKLLILLSSWLMATLSRKFIEQPFINLGISTRNLTLKTFSFALLASMLLASTSFYLVTKANADIAQKLKELENISLTEPCFGAEARLANGGICINDKITAAISPSLDLAAEDNPGRLYPECGHVGRSDYLAKICPLGDRNSSFKVLLAGDSHTDQFRITLDKLGLSQHWKVDSITKGGCPLNYLQREHDAELTQACTKWVANVMALATRNKYDLLVTSSASGVIWRTDSEEYKSASAGFAVLWSELNAKGTKVLVIKDNPRPVLKIVNCIASYPTEYMTNCSVPRATAFKDDPLVQAVATVASSNTKLLDLDDVYCNKNTCEPVIGKVQVYRDQNHLTSTFAGTLQKKFLVAIRILVPAN